MKRNNILDNLNISYLKPNILIILIDSLRGDHCNAESKSCLTPNLDFMINNGIYFNQAISSSDYTISGYGSIFTSLYPFNAGKKGVNYHKLFSKVPNYITHLKNNGYHTYATMDSNFLKLGFSEYFENSDLGYDRTTTGLFEGLEEQILEKIKSRNLKEPWFYFLHLDDLHIPIRLPEEFMNKKYSERYDFVVEKIDTFLGKILKEIDLEKTLVIFTADHGDYILSTDDSKKNSITDKIKAKIREKSSGSTYDYFSSLKRNSQRKIRYATTKSSLGKRTIDTRTAQNRFLFDDLIHIPLLFFGFGISKTGIVNDLVRSVDIFPTIAELIKIPNVQKNIDGRSLIPILNGEKIEEIPVYLENTIFVTDQESPQPCIGLRSSKFKYFRSLENPNEKIHLYDLKNDPLEENNIAESNSNLVNEMESALIQIRKKLDKKFEEPELTDTEEKEIEDELKKLGYI
jgi:arylsulfatase A-like enzyme